MLTLNHSQQSNTNPSGKKCVIGMSKCRTSPVSVADTIVKAQLVSIFLVNYWALLRFWSWRHHVKDINIFPLQSNDSPDAQITGVRNFNVSCSQLCTEPDDASKVISNSIISCAKPDVDCSFDNTPASDVRYGIKGITCSSRGKKPPYSPRRVLQSNPSSVPVANRFPVSALERRYYAVFCRLGLSERYQWYISMSFSGSLLLLN
jgi:hypothetical protein